MIQSLFGQTYTDFQAILVDDCSSDGSLDLALSFAKIDPRITVVAQEHAGVSSARNNALSYVKGEYILFLDGDDFLEPDLLEKLVTAQKKQMADVVFFRYRKIEESGTVLYEQEEAEKNFYLLEDGRDLWSFFLTSKTSNYNVCCKLFRSDIIKRNNLQFNESLYLGEDTLFFLEYMMFCKRISVIKYIGYNYIHHLNSLTTSHEDIWEHKIAQHLNFFQCLHDFIFDRKLFKYIPFLAGMAWMTLLKFNEAWKCSKDSLMLRKYKDSEILRTSVYPVIMKYGQWRRKIMTLIFRCSIRLFDACFIFIR